MEFKTGISKITKEDIIIRNEKLSTLLSNGKFSDAVFLLLSKRKPSKEESILFEKILISVIDHGMGTTSSLSSRFVISGGNELNVGVGAGILSIGNYHGGAIEKAMHLFYNWSKKSDSQIETEIEEMLESKKTIYGFGHKVYKEGDPRVKLIIKEADNINFKSTYLHLKALAENTIKKVKGRLVFLNIDGLIAIFLCDFGFEPSLGKGIFIIGRTPGLVAQCHEELTCEKPVRRLEEEEIKYQP